MQLPGSFSMAQNTNTRTVEEQAQEAILEATGASVDPIFDGRIHRFRVEGDKGTEKSGWYVFYDDRLPAGAFGNWKSGDDWLRWHADSVDAMAQREELEARWAEIRERRDREQKELWARTAETCRQIWDAAPEADASHPYLQRKQVQSHGLRQTGDGRLIVPVYVNGKLASLQYISTAEKDNKQFQPGGQTGGGYFRLPGTTEGPCFVAEGYATAASVHEATGCEVWVAFNAGNLSKVGQFLREKMPEADICFVADNDESGVGEKKARAAAEAIKARVILIPELGDANDYAVRGGDLRGLLLPEKRRWITPFSRFREQPQPIRWLVKNWIQAEGLHMMFGPSGVGKSFVALDIACSIASEKIAAWNGQRLRHGPVVYLAGEGYLGLKQRIVGWAAKKGIEELDICLSEEARDLNTPDGLRDTVQEIRELDLRPVFIVVDTLHRFMAGDENKAVDVKTMLDACATLAREFGCAVLLVHHTGVAQDAQDRARGSSAWRGAMDIELMVRGDGMEHIMLSQTKNKDAERQPVMGFEMVSVDVPGWFDEDGGQVTTKVLISEQCAEEEPEKALTPNQNMALLAYIEAAEQNGIVHDGEFCGLAKEDWRKAFYARKGDSNAHTKKVAFQRAQQDLMALGWLKAQGDSYLPIGLWAAWEKKHLVEAVQTAQAAHGGTK